MSWEPFTYVGKAMNFLKMAEINIYGIWIDCGSGYGYYSIALHNLGAIVVIAIDRDHYKLYQILRNIGGKVILPCQGDCRKLPIKDRYVDGCLMVNVLHYYQNPIEFVKEAARVLKFGGKIVVVEYKQSYAVPWNPFPLNAKEIQNLLKNCGFEIVTCCLVDKEYRPKHLVVGTLKGRGIK